MRWFLKLSCFLLPVGISCWSCASAPCLKEKSNLPEGSYRQARCDDGLAGNCMEGEFYYDETTDTLSFMSAVVKGFIGDVRFEKKLSSNEFSGQQVLHDACKWVSAGFDIDYDIENLLHFRFMLIPRQPQPDYEIKNGHLRINKLKDTAAFLEDNHIDGIRSSCPEFTLYVQPDVIFYRCSESLKTDAIASVMPYFYQFQKDAEFLMALKNLDGSLTPLKVIRVRGRTDYYPVNFTEEVRQQCERGNMQMLEVTGGSMCHTQKAGLLSGHLQEATNHTHSVYIDTHGMGYSVLHNCGIDSHLDVLMNVNKCFDHGLKLDYLDSRHRLFCDPGRFREAGDDKHQEL